MSPMADIFYQRYSTALLADAAFRSRVPVQVAPAGLGPLTGASKMAGPIHTVQANNDLVSILGAVHRAEEGEVVVIANRTENVGLLGDLIAAEAQRKGLAGFVVDGCVRDVPVLVDLDLAVFCRGRVPVGPLKLPAGRRGVGVIDVEVELGEAAVRPGQWAFGDADGVIFLCAEALDTVYGMAEQLLEREEQLLEDIQSGKALGDLLGVEAFLEERARNPKADFNDHLARLGRAI